MHSYHDDRKIIEKDPDYLITLSNQIVERIKNDKHNVFITPTIDILNQSIVESIKRFKEKRPRKLEGMFISVKDNIVTKNIRTTCGSKMLLNFIPIYDSTAFSRLVQSGAILVGKTNMDEFAMGSSSETSFFGAVRNPYNFEYVAGGSSGGSAAAVALNYCHTSLGSDTGGSVRLPSSFCGVIGLKPTYGSVSRYGLVAFASSLDQIGPMGNKIEDVALVYDVISGTDPNDSTTSKFIDNNTSENLEKYCHHNFRVAVLSPQIIDVCDEEVKKVYYYSIDKMRKSGVEVAEIDFPYFELSVAIYQIIANAEVSSNLARYDGIRYGYQANILSEKDIITQTRTQGFGDEVKRRIMLGTFVLLREQNEKFYQKAKKAKALIATTYKSIFEQYDFVFLPTSPTIPFKIGEKIDSPVQMYLSDFFTVSASLVGIPAINLPLGFSSNGLPIGMQLQSNYYSESKLLGFSKFLMKL